MAKSEINRYGKIRPLHIHKQYANRMNGEIDRINRPKNPQQKGIRQSILEIYVKEGRAAAKAKIDLVNQNLGRIVYTEEMMDNWIEQTRPEVLEKMKLQKQGEIQERDDDDDAR